MNWLEIIGAMSIVGTSAITLWVAVTAYQQKKDSDDWWN